nr:unnamed protein product [Callosobruchus chinensis]
MLQVCREEICKQIEKADYLSIQCDETTDVSNYCQMVLILRYFNEGSICEHFWGFIRIKDKTATGLKTCVENEIDPLVLKTPKKLIAQTYDGANVMSGVNNGVQAQIKIKYPNAHFIHCYAHQLNLIMQKSASQNAKVRVLPRAVITRWNYNIRTVNFVHENREKLIEVFEEIESRCEKSITSNEASGIRRALEDPEFIFWLELFHKILPQVDILYNQLQSKNKDTVQLQKDLIIFEKTDSNMDLNWARKRISDLHHLSEKIKKHESSRDHINSCTTFALLGKVNIMSQLSSAYRESIILHNNKVEKNRHILKRIISCVKFCSAFDLALRGHDESEFSENQGIFKELINFTAELDNTLKEHLRTATVFKGTSNTIQYEILESMLQVCREEICKQIEKADYLSIQCDETTDVSNYCQMVLILRYFNEGSICEHFWGFIRIKDKTATGLKTCIENEIDPLVLKTPQKLIAQTYDGANVMSGVNNGVQAQIK